MANAYPTGPDRLSLGSRAMRGWMLRWFADNDWRVTGALPNSPKMIIVGAQHTSNWDFLLFVGALHRLGRFAHFMGKNTLFRWPLKGLMYGLGGVPVFRSERRDMVQQMVEEFAHRDQLVLVIAPEGTRSPTDRWKTGFYQIALKAGVPMVCAAPDYPSKTVRIGPVVYATGDYEADMAPAFAFFRQATPRHPERGFIPS